MLNLTQLLSSRNNNPTFRYSQENFPVIVWNLTPSCNLDCSFCYYDATKAPPQPGINYALALRIARQLKVARIKYLLLSGGEPLLYPKLLTLIEELASSSIRVGLSTNGTLITQGEALCLKKSGIDYVGISLDGLKDTHNRLRKSTAAFNQALRGLRYAQGAGLKTGIRLTLNSYNFKQIKDIFLLAESLKVKRLCFYHLVYSGRAKNNNGLDLTRGQRKKAIELIIALTLDWIKRKIPAEVLTVDNFSDGVILLDYLRRKKSKIYPLVLELLKKQGGCPAGKKVLSIDHLGFLHPCQFWPEYKLADLKKEGLSDFLMVQESIKRFPIPLRKSPKVMALAKGSQTIVPQLIAKGNFLDNGSPFREWRLKLKGRCALCDFKEICGGCRVRSFQMYADYWQEDPSCCLED